MNDMICIEVDERETVTDGGIFLPGSVAEAPVRGRVLAVGPGTVDSNGNPKPIRVNEGDTVLFVKDTGVPFKLDNENEVMFLKEEHIVAIVQ